MLMIGQNTMLCLFVCYLHAAGVKRKLLDTFKARKLAYYGHIMRKQNSCLEKKTMQGTMPCTRREEYRTQSGCTTSIRGQDYPWMSIGITENRDNGESTSMGWPHRRRLKSRTELTRLWWWKGGRISDCNAKSIQCNQLWISIYQPIVVVVVVVVRPL